MPLPQTEMPGRLQAHFSERGIRMTEQRRAILSVIETARKHLDASQILRKAQKIDASVDRSTVYRTLRLLKRQGLIDELDLMHINGEGTSTWRACVAARLRSLSATALSGSNSKWNEIAGFECWSPDWRSAGIVRPAGDRSERVQLNKKASRLFSRGRSAGQPSPRTAKPRNGY